MVRQMVGENPPATASLCRPPRCHAGRKREFEAYWNDTFAFRAELIRWHHLAVVRLGLLRSDHVTVGRAGWLFLRNDNGLDYYRAVHPFTEADLAAWRRGLEKRRDWLAARGIAYLFVVAPNKDSIYPEFVPRRIRQTRPDSQLDQLLAYLRPRSTVDVLDLREALRAAKPRVRVFQRTDTHWNDVGAFVAYQAIMERVAKRLPQTRPMPVSAFDLQIRTSPGGDLAIMHVTS